MTITKQMVVNKLIELGIEDGCFHDNWIRIQSALFHGEPFPESCKPGAVIKRFKETASEEELEILENLTSDDFNHRIK